jgi:hypothetical protein
MTTTCGVCSGAVPEDEVVDGHTALCAEVVRKSALAHLARGDLEIARLRGALEKIAARFHSESIGPTGCPGGVGDHATCDGCVAREALGIPLDPRSEG